MFNNSGWNETINMRNGDSDNDYLLDTEFDNNGENNNTQGDEFVHPGFGCSWPFRSPGICGIHFLRRSWSSC